MNYDLKQCRWEYKGLLQLTTVRSHSVTERHGSCGGILLPGLLLMTQSACFLLWLRLTCPCIALSPVDMSLPTPIINQENALQNCLYGNLLEAFSHEFFFSDVFRFDQLAHKIFHSSPNAYFSPSCCSDFSPHSHFKAAWKPQVISTP